MLTIDCLPLGPFIANTYIVGDPATNQCVLIDATWDAPAILRQIRARGYTPTAIWLTHPHVDHLEAVPGLVEAYPDLPVGLHREGLMLYNMQGGARMFGFNLPPGPPPTLWFDEMTTISVGEHAFQIFSVPGHCPGHVAFYHAPSQQLFGGDVLFQGSIGRTDLPGGSFDVLMQSIHTHFLTLPDDTIVHSGHGPATTIGHERRTNPFLT